MSSETAESEEAVEGEGTEALGNVQADQEPLQSREQQASCERDSEIENADEDFVLT